MGTATTTALVDIAAQIAACTRCPLHHTRAKTVPGEGLPTSPVMLIGEGPGRVEDETGRPFVGPAGELLDALLTEAGLPREKLFVTNSIHCRAHANGRDRAPSSTELAACRPHLSAELMAVDPRIVVLLGGTAVRAVLGLSDFSIAAMRQRVLWRGAKWVVPTYHPSAELHARNGQVRQAITEDLALLRDMIEVEFGTRAWPWSDDALQALFGDADARLPSTNHGRPERAELVPGAEDLALLVDQSDAEVVPADLPLESVQSTGGKGRDVAQRPDAPAPRVIWAVGDLREPFRSSEVVTELLGRFAREVIHERATVGSLRSHDAHGFSIAPWHGPYISAPVSVGGQPGL